ncbi:MAG: glycosyltransferase [Hyphomonadaceae bacterium]|nr:glycosyltransferase [Hyphomonadaceae bacterium]
MILIEHSDFNQGTIQDNFGAPQYSYWFVRNAFRPVLDRLGERVEVTDPAREVDAIYREAKARGEPCLFLSFNPPQRTVLDLECPTLPVFAWEYDTIPNVTWNDNPRENWVYVLSRVGAAITLCRSSAAAARLSLGEDFPIWAIPSPLFDVYARRLTEVRGWRQPFNLKLDGALVISASDMDLSRFRPDRPVAEAVRALRVIERTAKEGGAANKVRLEGVVYTTVANPADGRKNWRDMVSAFVFAFRDCPTATLIFKLTHANLEDGVLSLLAHISMLGPFQCKIVLVNGLLADKAYADLIEATAYAVCTSLAEGNCLPLTEYMSAGRPAVTPAHTAMLDYVNPDNSFIVKSEERLASWPQDERAMATCRRYLVSFADLVNQFRASYNVAKNDPARFAAMSIASVDAMRGFCSQDHVAARLSEVFRYVTSRQHEARKATTHALP